MMTEVDNSTNTVKNTVEKYTVQVVVTHGIFEYDLASKDRALGHAHAIMTTGVYRRVNESGAVEFHKAHSVRVVGQGLESKYKDRFVRT